MPQIQEVSWEEEELQQEEPATEDADSAEGSQVDADADADAESAEEASESASEQEPLRFGATSTVAPFQTSGSLLIPRVAGSRTSAHSTTVG